MSFTQVGITLGPNEGKTVPVPGHPITIKARKEDTGGAYALLEAVLTGDGPPQHVHQSEEEAFYLLEGELNVLIGEDTHRVTPGSFVLVPRGTPHAFWNATTMPAKLLVLFSPGGFEEYFVETVGDEQIDTATFIQRGLAIADRYNLEILGPPLG